MGTQLHGRTALVTGSSSNIGRAIALELAREGANVVIHGRSRLPEAEAVAAEARALGVGALVCLADVSDQAAVRSMIARATEHFGGVDILLNSVGMRPTQTVLDASYEDWLNVLHANLYGAFYCCQAVLPGMVKRRWGRIINMSSRNAFTGVKGRIHEGSCKAAVHGLTRALAIEFAPYGITVNSISPGSQKTQRNPNMFSDWYWTDEDRLRQMPVGRLGEPWEVGKLCVYLASEDTGFITGTIIHMTGGAWGNVGAESLLWRSNPRGQSPPREVVR